MSGQLLPPVGFGQTVHHKIRHCLRCHVDKTFTGFAALGGLPRYNKICEACVGDMMAKGEKEFTIQPCAH